MAVRAAGAMVNKTIGTVADKAVDTMVDKTTGAMSKRLNLKDNPSTKPSSLKKQACRGSGRRKPGLE